MDLVSLMVIRGYREFRQELHKKRKEEIAAKGWMIKHLLIFGLEPLLFIGLIINFCCTLMRDIGIVLFIPILKLTKKIVNLPLSPKKHVKKKV